VESSGFPCALYRQTKRLHLQFLQVTNTRMLNSTELPHSVRTIFAAAGWEAGRRVAVPELVPHLHPAHAVLAEFGGLTVGQNGPGRECAKHSLVFGYVEPDPIILRWDDLLQSRLIGVADIEDGHAELYVDTSGRCFFASCIHDAFAFEGASFADAMERQLLGQRSQPMLRPDQSSVVMWGEVYTSDDPRVYKYR
jgi:SUKH-3 immunity protein